MWSFLKQLNNRDRAVHREEFSRHFEFLDPRVALRAPPSGSQPSAAVRQNLKQLRTYNASEASSLLRRTLRVSRRLLQAVFNLCLAQFRRTLQGVLV